MQRRRESIRTVADLQAFQEHVRRGLLLSLFAYPELPPSPSPLPVRKAAERLTLGECTIEMVSYQSMPGHWVTANLYVPHDVSPPVPGILCIADHSPEGKAAPYNQRLGRAFAERGYVALVIDYPDRGELIGGNDHFLNGAQVALTGLWSNGLFVTNALRGIDYLTMRSDLVDSKRIGVTGTSGGGATTAIVAAIDDRVAAAVPCCFLETYQRAIESGYTSCPEYFPPAGLVWPMEWSDILTVAIPRAVAPVSALEDSLFTQSGFDESVKQTEELYALAGEPERFRVVRTQEEHTYSPAMREAAYFWFANWLGAPKGDTLPKWKEGVRSADDVQYTLPDSHLNLIPAEDLAVNVPSSTSLQTIARDRAAALRRDRESILADEFGPPQAAQILDRVRHYFHSESKFSDLTIEVVSNENRPHGTVEEVILKSNHQCVQLPGLWAKPTKYPPKKLLLYLHEGGREKVPLEEIDRYLKSNVAVLAVDLRGFGQLYPRASEWDRYPWCDISRLITYGLWSLDSSVVHLQLADANMCLDFLKRESNSGNIPIYVLGVGRAAPIALFATALRPEINGLLGRGALVSFEDYVQHDAPTYNQMGLCYGILKEFDFPEVLAALADRLVLWAGVVDARGQRLNEKQIRHSMQLAIDAAGGRSQAFQAEAEVDCVPLIVGPEE